MKKVFYFIGGVVAGAALTLFTASHIPLDEVPKQDEPPEPDGIRPSFR